MARILIVYKQFPAPAVGHAGGQSVYRLLEHLRRRGHRLTLVARIQDEEKGYLGALRPLCDAVFTVPHHCSLPGPRAFALIRSYLALRRATVCALKEVQPDVFHVEFAQTAAVLLGIHHPHSSFRAHDVNWFLMEQQAAQEKGFKRLLSRFWGWCFRRLEPWLYRRFDLIAAISEGDRQLLAPRCAPKSVLLLPLSPNMEPTAEKKLTVAPPGPMVLFVGAMSRAYNVQGVQWFLEHVWPHVVSQVPDACFYIVGSSPPDSIRAYHDGRHVFVTGFVDDLASWYQAASVFVSPLLVAGGLLQKVMDAMGMGVPVVATSMSNHGLGATPEEHLYIADTPSAFAAAVVELLQNAQKRIDLGKAGQGFVRTHYDPEKALDCWNAALHQLLDHGPQK